MAINKAINRCSKSHAGMRNCIEYVLQGQKVKDGFVAMTGPAPDEVNWDTVYNAFLEEKRIWSKDSGRLYAHNVVSFHKDEDITPEQAFEIAQEIATKVFPDYQTLISVHQDKEHIHAHLVTNTVSYVDGHKLHMTKYDLESMKQLTNQLCMDKGLSIAHKGEHFDGTKIEETTIISWSKDKYQALRKKINIVLIDCVAAVLSAKACSSSKEEFIQRVSENGWKTAWVESKKHLTFINGDGKKIRDSNISKNYSVDISKDSLQRAFEINAYQQISSVEYNEIKRQLNGDKVLRMDLVTRIKSLEEFLRECEPNESEQKEVLKKIEILKRDKKRLDEAIAFLSDRIKNTNGQKKEVKMDIEIQADTTSLMHF